MKKERKYWIKLTWVLTCLIELFGVFASRESLALAHSYFPVVEIVCKLHIFWICYETLILITFKGIFGFDIDRKFG